MISPRRLALARSVIAAIGLLASVAFVIPAKQQAIRRPVKTATPQWYRGNTHTHTNNSDGDSSPHDVAERYKSLGYNFVVITDHNKLTDVDSLNAELGSPGEFL